MCLLGTNESTFAAPVSICGSRIFCSLMVLVDDEKNISPDLSLKVQI